MNKELPINFPILFTFVILFILDILNIIYITNEEIFIFSIVCLLFVISNYFNKFKKIIKGIAFINLFIFMNFKKEIQSKIVSLINIDENSLFLIVIILLLISSLIVENKKENKNGNNM